MFGFGSSSSTSTSDASSSSPSLSAPPTEATKTQAIKDYIRQETLTQNVQDLMNNSTEKCFKSCVTNPGTSLTSKEEQCMATCFQKYLQAFDAVSRAYTANLRQVAQQAGQQSDSQETFLR